MDKKSEYLNREQLKNNNIPFFRYFDKHCSSLESQLPEKYFQSLIKEPNYFFQPTTNKIWLKDIPQNYIHDFLLKLFDINKIDQSHYNTIYFIIFKNHDIKNLEDFVPYFSDKKTLKENLPFHYLNEKGIDELKIILWI